MEIIYEYIATDEETHIIPLSPYLVNCTLYNSLFVASNSNFAMWEDNG